jgi:hypothetical protein
VSTHIIAHWYADPSFRDPTGKPLLLPLQGSGPTLATLIRRVFPTQSLERVVQSLLATGAVVQRGGLFSPFERWVALNRDAPSVHLNTLVSVSGMLRTVRHNIATTSSNDTLLERSAKNPCIPVRLLPEIHTYFKRELTRILWRFDGYLRSHEVEPGSEPTTQVGLGFYVFEDPLVTGTGLEWTEPSPENSRTRANFRRAARKRRKP